MTWQTHVGQPPIMRREQTDRGGEREATWQREREKPVVASARPCPVIFHRLVRHRSEREAARMQLEPPGLLFATLAIGAPKRKAPAGGGGSGRVGHYGLRDDSSAQIALVALSRVAQARDEAILQTAAQTPAGVALLALLKAAVLRVAVTVGGADPSLSSMSVMTLFNLSGSGVASQRLFDGGLSLPTKLPWPQARALVAALLNALNAARASDVGGRLGILLLTLPPVAVDAKIQAELTAFVAEVEAGMRVRLSGNSGDADSGGGGDGGSGASSSRSTPPPQPELPAAEAVPIRDAIQPTLTLSDNARTLLEARLGRRLSASEGQRVEEALAEALSVLQAGGAEARRRLLSTSMATAMLNPGVAMTWGCVVETISDGDASSIGAFSSALVATASTIAGALFASAFGV